MPTTSNFGWTTPADTDLVKDGALAIRTLGNGIDTTMAELKGGTTGQVLSKTSNTDMDFTWVTTDDANAIQNAIVDAKGDLIAASAADTPARLAVGSDGETLVADSSATTGLRWQGNFAAGKNKIINGDFAINQRNFTSVTSDTTYGFDRWMLIRNDGTTTYSAQTFTPGTAPVSGYEATNFARLVTTGQTSTGAYSFLVQRLEDVRSLAGQTVTISFWAKANSGTPKVSLEIQQYFGTGGSPSATVNTYAGQVTISTSWARYSVTIAVPSISGKTIGTTMTGYVALDIWVSGGSDFNARTGSLGIQTNTFDFWGVQIEAGNVATAFQTATGTLAGELAACQRYYVRFANGSVFSAYGYGNASSTTQAYPLIALPSQMRIAPTTLDYSTIQLGDTVNAGIAVTNLTIQHSNPQQAVLEATVASGLTQYRSYQVRNANSTSGYIGFSAEL